MNQSEQLQSVVRWRTKKKSARTAKLGDVVEQLMDSRISPRQARFGSVTKVWGQLLPAELRSHCRITEVSDGQLKVLADSPSYVHELRLCSPELLEELARQCPRARIREIKLTVG
jgi:predicted nucleic acid-binding Zn ribbon protein